MALPSISPHLLVSFMCLLHIFRWIGTGSVDGVGTFLKFRRLGVQAKPLGCNQTLRGNSSNTSDDSKYSRLLIVDPESASFCSTCEAPSFDNCRYNASSCAGVMVGSSCDIRCLSPFRGSAVEATCVNAPGSSSPIVTYSLPECECPIPEIIPNWVRWNSHRELLQCDPNYEGVPQIRCEHSQNCKTSSQYIGCAKHLPCAEPFVDHCRFDTSSCLNVTPGGSCEMRCKHPFVGAPTTATCPFGNLDPLQQVVWSPMRCVPEQCSDPNKLPYGYTRGSDGILQCADGFTGEVERTCMPDADWQATCTTIAQLRGCEEVVPCDIPKLEGTDACVYDFTSCSSVEAGKSCNVYCVWPFEAFPSVASCPMNNTKRHGLRYTLPACVASSCGVPELIPRGYRQRFANRPWECESGYQGKAEIICEPLYPPYCGAAPRFIGCRHLSVCLAPEVNCKYDMSDCSNVLPGSNCTVRCNPPFLGMSSIAQCPDDNEDPNGLRWYSLDCAPPKWCSNPSPPPLGYDYNGSAWVCADGFFGNDVEKQCVWNETTCAETVVLSGCLEQEACIVPELSAEDTCKLNFSACESVFPGNSCNVTCKSPYIDNVASFSCPKGNVDPTTELLGSRPTCLCPDPDFAHIGYEKSIDGDGDGWTCAPGFAGRASKLCRAAVNGSSCALDVAPGVLIGCAMPIVCAVSDFSDDGSTLEDGVSGTVAFGQAAINGEVSETDIIGYNLMFLDQCETPLNAEGDSLISGWENQSASGGFVESRNNSNISCCMRDYYSITLRNVLVPPSAVQLVLVARTAHGEIGVDAGAGVRVPMPANSAAAAILAAARGAGGRVRSPSLRAPAVGFGSRLHKTCTVVMCLAIAFALR